MLDLLQDLENRPDCAKKYEFATDSRLQGIFPCIFPVNREFGPETESLQTAATAIQSRL